MADARSCKPACPFSDGPRRCVRRTIRDCRGCRSSRAGCRCGRCGNRRGIELRLGCSGRLGLRVRSCLGRCRDRCSSLCRCTPATGGCRPRRSGGVSGRYWSRRVCLFFPYSVFAKLVVGVCPDLGIAGWLFDFGADELVFEIVLVILVFAIGQLAVDQIAQCIVGVFDAVEFGDSVAVGAV